MALRCRGVREVDGHGFRRTRVGRIVVRLDDVERSILTDLVSQLVELVTPDSRPWGEDEDPLARLVGIDPLAERSNDPALARLFPDAYPDDDEASGEFRRFTERSLRDVKLAHARTVLASLERTGGKLTLGDAEALAWLGCLNDVRLAVGSRLEITEDNADALEELDEDDPRFMLVQVYGWLTFLQETLVHAVARLDPASPTPDDD
jgi:hypothetical protein